MNTTSFSIHDLLTLRLASGRGDAHRFFRDELARFLTASTQRPDVRVVVGPLPQHRSSVILLDNRKYTVSGGSISFSARYKVFRLLLMLTNLQGPETTLHFDGHPLAYRLLFLKFIVPVLRLRLLQQGLTLVKASAIEGEGGACLLPAWSGGGKTSLVLHALERGYALLSDTFSLVSEHGEVYPLPRPLHVFWRNVAACPSLWAHASQGERLALGLKYLLYVLSLRSLNLSHRLALERVAVGRSPRQLRSVLFLTQADGPGWRGERGLPLARAADKMLVNDRYETRLFDAAYWAYAESQSRVWDYWRTHSQVLAGALRDAVCNEVCLPGRPHPEDFERVLDWQMA